MRHSLPGISRGIAPGVVYKVTHEKLDAQFAYTPDGIGMIWYDTLAELVADTGLETAAIVQLTEQQLDERREH